VDVLERALDFIRFVVEDFDGLIEDKHGEEEEGWDGWCTRSSQPETSLVVPGRNERA